MLKFPDSNYPKEENMCSLFLIVYRILPLRFLKKIPLYSTYIHIQMIMHLIIGFWVQMEESAI